MKNRNIAVLTFKILIKLDHKIILLYHNLIRPAIQDEITTKVPSNKMSTSLAYAVLIALIANLLSVSALRCHQCNSHENEDCASLLVNTPRAQRDNQYLTDCVAKGEQQAFCRKTVIKFEVNHEHRIERSCGWIEEKSQNSCFTADNEGYKQIICTCSDEGCNGATSLLGPRQMGYSLMATILSLIVVNLINH